MLALVGAFALAGCGQPPGFELSWRIDDAPLEAVKQCSDVGIFAVRVTVSLGAEVVAIDEHPCISSVESSVEGPPLEPGEYTIVVEGLRRSGEPWAFDPGVDVERIAYDSTSVIVSEGALPSVEAVLLAPPQCDDGIDNDRDGTVDGQDPGCELDVLGAEPSESNDADDTLFQIAVTFLGSSVVKPANVGVQSLRLEVDGELLAQISSSQLDYTQSPFRLPLLAKDLEGEGHDLEITAIGADGALTETQAFPITSTYFNQVVDFGSGAFLQPIVEPLALVFEPDCSPGGGNLELETMRIRVLDENGTPVDAATLGLSGTTIVGGSAMSIQPVDDGDWVSFECPSSAVRSTDLPWGRYSIETQARLANVACFESPVTDLAPQPVSAQTIVLERVLNDGVAACPECSVDPQDPDASNCEVGLICEGGLCVAEDNP